MGPIDAVINPLRKQIGEVAKAIKALKDEPLVQGITDQNERGEALANVMLAYRHLEDARMRLGKVIQAADGGISVYDKEAA